MDSDSDLHAHEYDLSNSDILRAGAMPSEQPKILSATSTNSVNSANSAVSMGQSSISNSVTSPVSNRDGSTDLTDVSNFSDKAGVNHNQTKADTDSDSDSDSDIDFLIYVDTNNAIRLKNFLKQFIDEKSNLDPRNMVNMELENPSSIPKSNDKALAKLLAQAVSLLKNDNSNSNEKRQITNLYLYYAERANSYMFYQLSDISASLKNSPIMCDLYVIKTKKTIMGCRIIGINNELYMAVEIKIKDAEPKYIGISPSKSIRGKSDQPIVSAVQSAQPAQPVPNAVDEQTMIIINRKITSPDKSSYFSAKTPTDLPTDLSTDRGIRYLSSQTQSQTDTDTRAKTKKLIQEYDSNKKAQISHNARMPMHNIPVSMPVPPMHNMQNMQNMPMQNMPMQNMPMQNMPMQNMRNMHNMPTAPVRMQIPQMSMQMPVQMQMQMPVQMRGGSMPRTSSSARSSSRTSNSSRSSNSSNSNSNSHSTTESIGVTEKGVMLRGGASHLDTSLDQVAKTKQNAYIQDAQIEAHVQKLIGESEIPVSRLKDLTSSGPEQGLCE